MHQKEVNPQDMVTEKTTLLILKHDKDIITLIGEVHSIKLVIQSLAVQLVNKETKPIVIIPTANKITIFDFDLSDVMSPSSVFSCVAIFNSAFVFVVYNQHLVKPVYLGPRYC